MGLVLLSLFVVAFVVDVRLDLHLIRMQTKSPLRWFPPGCGSVAVAVTLADEFIRGPR